MFIKDLYKYIAEKFTWTNDRCIRSTVSSYNTGLHDCFRTNNKKIMNELSSNTMYMGSAKYLFNLHVGLSNKGAIL